MRVDEVLALLEGRDNDPERLLEIVVRTHDDEALLELLREMKRRNEFERPSARFARWITEAPHEEAPEIKMWKEAAKRNGELVTLFLIAAFNRDNPLVPRASTLLDVLRALVIRGAVKEDMLEELFRGVAYWDRHFHSAIRLEMRLLPGLARRVMEALSEYEFPEQHEDAYREDLAELVLSNPGLRRVYDNEFSSLALELPNGGLSNADLSTILSAFQEAMETWSESGFNTPGRIFRNPSWHPENDPVFATAEGYRTVMSGAELYPDADDDDDEGLADRQFPMMTDIEMSIDRNGVVFEFVSDEEGLDGEERMSELLQDQVFSIGRMHGSLTHNCELHELMGDLDDIMKRLQDVIRAFVYELDILQR